MGRTPYDTFSKELTVDVLAPLGRAESDARIAPDPQYADVCFEPTATRRHGGASLLHRLTWEGRAMFEFARQPPDVPEMGTWLGKLIGWWRRLGAEARREEKPSPTLPPRFWGLSSGRPTQALDVFRMRSMDEAQWPEGCYEGAPGGLFRVIVISELPRTRDTLLVRTMGAGVTFREAMEDLRTLPPDAPERVLAGPHLVRLSLQLQNDPSEDAREMVMQAQKLYDELMERQLRLGMEKGHEEARRQYDELMERQLRLGREEGLRPLERQFERRLSRPLTAAERSVLLERFSSVGPDRLGDVVLDLDPAALSAWLADPAAH